MIGRAFKAAACLILSAMPSLASPTQTTPPAMFPPEAMAWDETMSDGVAPILAAMDEPPLWTAGAITGSGKVYRFTFVGNLCKATSIRITDGAKGATLHAVSLDRCKVYRPKVLQRNKRIAATDIAELEGLMRKADMWQHAVGDWDGEGGHVWVDCTFLVMERAQASDYRLERSQISCIQPAVLIPVVNKVAGLAGLSHRSLGYLDRAAGEQSH
jgi:hypothetical protein